MTAAAQCAELFDETGSVADLLSGLRKALLAETLTQRYDEDWWRNPRAGPWFVQSLLSEGQRELAHEQAKRVSGRELSFAPLVREIERLLG